MYLPLVTIFVVTKIYTDNLTGHGFETFISGEKLLYNPLIPKRVP